jgi:hypothetical protein
MWNSKDYFVIQYPLWEVDQDTLQDMYNAFMSQITTMFGDKYAVLMIPNTFQLNVLTKEQLQEIVNSI